MFCEDYREFNSFELVFSANWRSLWPVPAVEVKKSDQEKLAKGWGGGGGGGVLFFIVFMRSPLSERLDSLRSLRPHPHEESGHFLTAFFTRIRVDRVLNHSEERFQKDAFSVGGFTGFSFLFPFCRQSAPERLLVGYDGSGPGCSNVG